MFSLTVGSLRKSETVRAVFVFRYQEPVLVKGRNDEKNFVV
jgi:hypothetical protein